MKMIKSIKFDTIQAALDDRLGAGGWLFWSYEDGSATWFPYTATQDDALKAVKGNGYLATWNTMEAKVNGPIGGPRGRGI
jgi:hypothetical protein